MSELPQQLLLDILPLQKPNFDNFVSGRNAQLLHCLTTLASDSPTALYLWGAPGSGRSHLLRAAHEHAGAIRPTCYFHAAEIGDELNAPAGTLVLIDDVEDLSANAQVTMFRLFNRAQTEGLTLVLSGHSPPLQLNLREDLRNRIGQMLIFQVLPLSDEEKAAAMKRHTAARGMRVDDSLISWLLNHTRRDLPALIAWLDVLDRVSMQTKRPPTLPLLKELLTAAHHKV